MSIHDADLCALVPKAAVQALFQPEYGQPEISCQKGMSWAPDQGLVEYLWEISPLGGLEIYSGARFSADGNDKMMPTSHEEKLFVIGEFDVLWTAFSGGYQVAVEDVIITYVVTPIGYPPTDEIQNFIIDTAATIAAHTSTQN